MSVDLCGICFETKECLSFPCCDNHFKICKPCLEKHPKNCPQCRIPFELQHNYISRTKTTIEWKSTLILLLFFIVTTSHIYGYVKVIQRDKKCENQPCYIKSPIDDKEHPCKCGSEFADCWSYIITFIIFLVVTLFNCFDYNMDYTSPSHPIKKYIIKSREKLFFLLILYSFMNAIYLWLEYNHSEYKNDNNNVLFIYSYTFILLMTLLTTLCSFIFYHTFKFFIICIPSLCCTHNTITTDSISVIISSQESQPLQVTTVIKV